MKITSRLRTASVIVPLALTLFTSANAQGPGAGRGMPAELRDTIHGLFDSHDKFERKVEVTDDGYVSQTTSKDPAMVTLLQTHVKQMEKRLKQGLMVRRWDPAYEEFVNYYDDIHIAIKNIDNGISITAVGATEDAKKVARNHAGIISKFIANGWDEHDKTHAAVVGVADTEQGSAGAAVEGAESKVCEDCAKSGGEKCADCVKPPQAKAGGEKCADCAKPQAENTLKASASGPIEACSLGSTKPVHSAGNIYLSGQPNREDFLLAKEQGIKTIVNLRHNKETEDFDEKGVVETIGLNYIHLPWNGTDELTDAIFDQTRQLLATAEGPILLHCGSANRVGAVWLPWRVLDGGVDVETALSEARSIGLKQADYEEKARDYISRNQSPK